MASVILLEKLMRYGNIGEVVEVKNGFARNYLVPSGKAIYATEANRAVFEARRKDIEHKNEERLAEARKIAEVIDRSSVDIQKQAGDDGKLYGSVTAKEIATVLSNMKGIAIPSSAIKLKDKVKAIGEYEMKLELHPDVIVSVMLNIVRSHDDTMQ